MPEPYAAPRPLPESLKTPAWAGVATDAENVPDGDVIISARARLARNINGYPFPSRANDVELRRVAQAVRQAAHADTGRLLDLIPIEMASLPPRDRAELVDARRISPDLASGGAERYALLDTAGRISIFVNEEDHIRMQALAPGNTPQAALRDVQDVEARLACRLKWAQDAEKWGYLTASMSNTGTGLRLSVLAHLPALVFLNRLDRVFDAAKQLGVSVRGAHGEHSLAAGDLFQVSNEQTLGISVENTAGRVRSFADILVRDERTARRELAGDRGRRDRALKAARFAWDRTNSLEKLSARDSLEILSALRLCAACGLLPWRYEYQITAAPDDRLFAHLLAELRTGGGLTGSEGSAALRDAIGRPALLRSALAPIYIGAV
jgi:protein arginine kinase